MTQETATPLRAALLDVYKQRLVSAGKGEKMEAVYDYVTSPQFAHKLRAVHEVMQRMREELESEKNQTQQRWARREKQLQVGVARFWSTGRPRGAICHGVLAHHSENVGAVDVERGAGS